MREPYLSRPMPWTPYLLTFLSGCSPDWSVRVQPSPDRTKTAVEIVTRIAKERRVFPWPVWTVQHGDVDGDGCEELILGAVKRNRFDSASRRRLQVWRVTDGRLHPRWLGTRLAGSLDTFILDAQGRIVARERVGDRWTLARWRWRKFGFQTDSVLTEGAQSRPPLPSNSRKDAP
ncbi:MAG: hypothetical protein IPO40_10110 [Fibrobacteres bacterium]|nr:hypothetical protein [Fibrobacterota bacterium]